MAGRDEMEADIRSLFDSGDLSVAAEAIGALEAAMSAAGPNKYQFRVALAVACQIWFEHTGDDDAQAAAIALFREELADNPPGSPHRGACLADLAEALTTLGTQTGDLAALREAADLLDEAAAAAAGPYRVGFRSRQAMVLRYRYDVSGDESDLRDAVAIFRALAAATPPGHPERAVALNNLALTLTALYGRTSDGAVIAESIESLRAATVIAEARGADSTNYRVHLASALEHSYTESADIAVLEEALALRRTVFRTLPVDHPMRAEFLNDLGNALRNYAVESGADDLLHEAVRIGRQSVAAGVADRVKQGAHQVNLAESLVALSRRTEAADALDAAIELYRAAQAAVPGSHIWHRRFLIGLAHALMLTARRTGAFAAAEEAIAVLEQAADETPDDDPGLAGVLGALASAWRLRHQLRAEPGDLVQSVEYGREALSCAGPDHRDRADLLTGLADSLHTLFECGGAGVVLEEVIGLHREAVAVAPVAKRHYPLHGLAISLHTSAEWRSDVAALDEAIGLYRDAARTTSDLDSRRVLHLNLADALLLRYEWQPEVATLEEAAGLCQAVVEQTRAGHESRSRALRELGAALLAHYEHTGRPELRDEAITRCRQAVAEAPTGHPEYARCCSGLGNALRRKIDDVIDPNVLDEAIGLYRAAVDAMPADSPESLSYLGNLAHALRTRYLLTRDSAALHESVRYARGVVEATTAGHVEEAMRLAGLGNSLHLLFDLERDRTVLDEAVRTWRRTVERTPPGHLDRGVHSAQLGTALHALYQETHAVDAITEAVAVYRDAVATTPEEHPARTARSADLADGLWALSEAMRAEEARTEGAWADGVRVAPISSDAALDEAIGLYRTVLAAMAAEHPRRATTLHNLGVALRDRHRQIADPDTLVAARAAFRDAMSLRSGSLRERILSGIELSRLELRTGAATAALAVLEKVAELVPQFASRALARADRERGLGRLAGLPAQMAATAVAAGRPDLGAVLLEQTRALLIGEVLEDRAAALELAALAPDLAVELRDLQERMAALELGETTSGITSSMTGDDRRAGGGRDPLAPDLAVELRARTAASGIGQSSFGADLRLATERGERRRAHFEQWQDLTARIRRRPGLEGYLRPPTIEQLCDAAGAGPIIMPYADRETGGAIVLTADGATAVTLPRLTVWSVFDQLERLLDGWHAAEGPVGGRAAAQRDIRTVLGWVWDEIAEPVLDHLKLRGEPGTRPRVWWCPIGQLAWLPLHAAGREVEGTSDSSVPIEPLPLQAGRRDDEGSRECSVPDRVVSSCITTVRALVRARMRSGGADPSALIVGMPIGAGDEPDGVDAEMADLAALLPDSRIIYGADADYAAVAAALPRHSIAHFACHGFTSMGDPARGALVLSDYRERPLTVVELSRMNLGAADLAYLSACSTAQGSPQLADEAIHVTAAIQLAGYRHVIGTLWPINDAAAAAFAREFYGRLTGGGQHVPRTDDSAIELNHVVRDMRSRYPKLPTRWAAYLHQGV
ncbi:CHAT domain-containing protein [Nocardia sp. NPDC127579]|uniref:CHAT domain-containing protein n=1 Tax=Nocardia sp. NPDC127579 TaxID=3345402 RepID=UPI00363A8C60